MNNNKIKVMRSNLTICTKNLTYVEVHLNQAEYFEINQLLYFQPDANNKFTNKRYYQHCIFVFLIMFYTDFYQLMLDA